MQYSFGVDKNKNKNPIVATSMKITGLQAFVKVAIEALLEESELSTTDLITHTKIFLMDAHNRVQEENTLSRGT